MTKQGTYTCTPSTSRYLHLAKVIISILTRLFFNSVRIKIEISTTKISLCPVALQGSTLRKKKEMKTRKAKKRSYNMNRKARVRRMKIFL